MEQELGLQKARTGDEHEHRHRAGIGYEDLPGELFWLGRESGVGTPTPLDTARPRAGLNE